MATKSQRGMSSAALSKTEIVDLHKTAIEAATLTGMATATKQASTQTDSGAARVELLSASMPHTFPTIDLLRKLWGRMVRGRRPRRPVRSWMRLRPPEVKELK